MPVVEEKPRLDGPRTLGRYVLHGELASGGMAVVHYGRLLGPVGFSRTVAIKRLHSHLAKDPGFCAMFLDEARLAARIRHPNVVPTLDVLEEQDALYLVMEYVHGESLDRLLRSAVKGGEKIPPAIAAGIVRDVLHGLHAAHEATSERGKPLGIVHRDVSPQNVLVGVDGLARVLDFGIAKAQARMQLTAEGQLKGKIAYMAPEQVEQTGVDRRADVWSASVVLWETLTGKRLFVADHPAQLMKLVLAQAIPPPRELAPEVSEELQAVVLCGLERDPDARFATAEEMALALAASVSLAPHHEIGAFTARVAEASLAKRARVLREIEGGETASVEVALPPPSNPAQQTLVATSLTNAETRAMTQPLAPPSADRRWLAYLGVAAVAGGVGAAAAVLFRAESAPPPAAAPPAPVESTRAPPEPSATPAAAETQSAPPDAGPPKAPPARRTWPARPTSPAPMPKDCNPPYTTGKDGVRVPKLHCL